MQKDSFKRSRIDFNEAYAPTSSLKTIRRVVAIAFYKGSKMNKLDVSSAFLSGLLKNEVMPSNQQALISNAMNIKYTNWENICKD